MSGPSDANFRVTELTAQYDSQCLLAKIDLSSPPASASTAHAPSPENRMARGRALRDRVPRTQHGTWKKGENRPDPINTLRAADADRLPDLVPIRYGRMLRSPFAFYREAAG